MKNQFLYLIIFALISNVIYSQSGELSGKIMDKEYNDILPFANVIVKETGGGTTTDFEGNYSLKVYPGETIKYSFLGYEPHTILVGSQLEINVNFKDEDQNMLLGEVLILDYKQIKKEERREKRRLKKEKGH